MSEMAAAWTCLNCGKTWISATGWSKPSFQLRCGACGVGRYAAYNNEIRRQKRERLNELRRHNSDVRH